MTGPTTALVLEPVPDLFVAKLVLAAKLLRANGMTLRAAKRALEEVTWGVPRLAMVTGDDDAIVSELAGLGFPAHRLAECSDDLLAELTVSVTVPTQPGTVWKAAPLARRVRVRLDLDQKQFAARFCIPVATIRDWELGGAPHAGVVSLLWAIAADPDSMARSMAKGHRLSTESASLDAAE